MAERIILERPFWHFDRGDRLASQYSNMAQQMLWPGKLALAI